MSRFKNIEFLSSYRHLNETIDKYHAEWKKHKDELTAASAPIVFICMAIIFPLWFLVDLFVVQDHATLDKFLVMRIGVFLWNVVVYSLYRLGRLNENSGGVASISGYAGLGFLFPLLSGNEILFYLLAITTMPVGHGLFENQGTRYYIRWFGIGQLVVAFNVIMSPLPFLDIIFKHGGFLYLTFCAVGVFIFIYKDFTTKKGFILTMKVQENARRSHSILSSIPDAIFTIESHQGQLTIGKEYSSFAQTISGKDERLYKQDPMAVFFGRSDLNAHQKDTLRNTLSLSLDEDVIQFQVNAHVLPQKLNLSPFGSDQNHRTCEMTWRPITNDVDTVTACVVVIRDVTEILNLRAHSLDAEKRNSIVIELLGIKAEESVEVLYVAHQLIDDAKKEVHKLDREDNDPGLALAIIYRNIHTIKGLTVTYHLAGFSEVLHHGEKELSELRGHTQELGLLHGRLDSVIRTIEAELLIYTSVNEETLGRSLEMEFIEVPTIENFIKEYGTQEIPESFIFALQKLYKKSFRKIVEPIAINIGKVAQSKLNKPAPKIEVKNDIVFVQNPDVRVVLKKCLTHLFRNAIDHGIEPPSERIKAGKPEAGRIELALDLNEQHISLEISDDGQGLNLRALKSKLESGDITLKPGAPITEAIFLDGISTKKEATELSGRGVGMAAVRAELESIDGSIDAIITGSERQGFVPFKFRIHLPVKHFEVQLDGGKSPAAEGF
ncbi:ATP-binding protein [Pseudobacteriovorax antillogorgiicola]|uniref:ATP-binding protein n=1 Tax=Pseudobacteriovorax antillogorgiicola TaxID=1513793 RepID=UPI0013566ED1|nr:ATP-binding protein [Pseudobacteriovorax antillogorgiicola]